MAITTFTHRNTILHLPTIDSYINSMNVRKYSEYPIHCEEHNVRRSGCCPLLVSIQWHKCRIIVICIRFINTYLQNIIYSWCPSTLTHARKSASMNENQLKTEKTHTRRRKQKSSEVEAILLLSKENPKTLERLHEPDEGWATSRAFLCFAPCTRTCIFDAMWT